MNQTKDTPALPFITLVVGLLFMANAAVLVKLSDAPGIVTTFYRMFLGAVILVIPFVIHRLRSPHKLSRKGIWYAIAAGSCFGFDMALWSTGVVASNATLPTLMANMAPIWVGFGSMLIFKEKHRPGFWLGLILAVSGLPIMFSQDIHGSGNVILGAMLGLGAGLFYGAFYLFSQPGRQVMDTLSYLFVSTASSSAILFILVLVFDYSLVGYSQNTWLIFGGLGLGVQVIGWFLINYSQGFLPASIVAPTLLGQPIITALMAALILHEQLTQYHWIGGCVVIAGIYVVHFGRKKRK